MSTGFAVHTVKSPSRAPDARLDMIREWGPTGYYTQGIRSPDVVGTTWSHAEVEAQRTRHQAILAGAPLFWISADASDAIMEVAPGVPFDITADPSMFPPSGLAFFEDQPVMSTTSTGIAEFRTQAIEWVSGPDMFVITPYAGRPDSRVSVVAETKSWKYGTPLSEAFDPAAFALLVAVFAIAKEPRIATATDEPADRPSRRRSERAGVDLGATRVIYLRGSSAETSGEGSSREHHHRWIVSGHWRSQPYGPERKLRRPVYIAPHVKGPEGAPLLHGEKVRAIL